MAIIIYTYTNPYKINHEKYWALIKNAFHLCVSQTLVNGLCDQYREFYQGKLTTLTRFINNLFNDWESDAANIQQRAAVDNIIDYMDFNALIVDDISDSNIRTSLKRNRGYVVDSLRIMFELGMNPENIQTSALTCEQKCVVGMFRELLANKNKAFAIKKDFTKEEIDGAIDQTIDDSIKNNNIDIADINKNTIIVHGVHQFTPIMLRMIEVLSRYKNVVLLFNYQPDYKNVYQTWVNVYSWFESKINYSNQNFNNESTEFEGGIIAENMAAMIAGSTAAVDLRNKVEVTEFNNQTEFAGYVAKQFEKAKQKWKEDNFKHPALYYMDEQIYSANSAVNQILKIYFPDQFGEREFLDYPIGHFFISIVDMWDPKTESMTIKDLNDVKECLSCGIIDEARPGELASTFENCRLYLSNETTLRGMIKRLKKLKRLLPVEDIDLKRLEYYNVTVEETENLIRALRELDEIADRFFEDFNDTKNDFKEFYKKIADVLVKKVLEKKDLDEDFKDIVERVLERLDEVKDIEASASLDCLKESMQLYLQQFPAEGKGANWIVRNFEQIDGDVLRRTSLKNAKSYHFACLSDQDMSITHKDKFPWPLDIEFFEVAQAPVDWKYQVYVTSRTEYKNFRRYALIYGLEFSKSKIKLSFIKNENDSENDLYYLLKILNAQVKSYIPGEVNNSRKDPALIKIASQKEKQFNQFDLMKYRLCHYRFLLDSVVEGHSVYKDEFLLKQYLTIILENRARRHFSGKPFIKDMVNGYLNDHMEELSTDFPFINHLDTLDIIKKAMEYLGKYAARRGTFSNITTNDENTLVEREEFLFAPSNCKSDQTIQEIFKRSTIEEVNSELTEAKFTDERYRATLNSLCNRCADKDVCVEIYGTKKQ